METTIMDLIYEFYRGNTPIIEKQMEKKLEHEMETGIV